MKKNLLLFVLLIIATSSCNTRSQSGNTCLHIYKSEGAQPEYLLLRECTLTEKVFEYYAPGIQGSVLGKWSFTEAKDTLFLYPEYVNYFDEGIKAVEKEKLDIRTHNQIYRIKKDKLYNITDYSDIGLEVKSRKSLKYWAK